MELERFIGGCVQKNVCEKKMIVIAPWAKKMRNDQPHPKDYPYWQEVIGGLDMPIVQVGVAGEKQLVKTFYQNISLARLAEVVGECQTWIAVDSFFQHFCWDLGKQGVVLWGQSDPNIFGHPENVNLLKDRKYLREKQFWWWEQCEFKKEAFVEPQVVIDAVKQIINKQ